MQWRGNIPIYATRPDADGWIGSVNVPSWTLIVLLAMIVLNAVLWGIIGIIEAVTWLL